MGGGRTRWVVRRDKLPSAGWLMRIVMVIVAFIIGGGGGLLYFFARSGGLYFGAEASEREVLVTLAVPMVIGGVLCVGFLLMTMHEGRKR